MVDKDLQLKSVYRKGENPNVWSALEFMNSVYVSSATVLTKLQEETEVPWHWNVSDWGFQEFQIIGKVSDS